MTDFKPGDVVQHPEHGRGIVQAQGDRPADPEYVEFEVHYGLAALDDVASNLRRLVVIDPEDHEQVLRLVRAYHATPACHDVDARTAAALREFATPTSPRIDEPTGLGAVVEDGDGRRWVKSPEETNDSRPWCSSDAGWRAYANIAAVRVLSEGITP